VGRALSLSFIAHAAFALSFLLLSATRKPLVIPQAARPVRLVTYLEPLTASRPQARTVAQPREVPAAAAPARPAPRVEPPAVRATPPAAVRNTPPATVPTRVEPVPVPRGTIPIPTEAPPARRAEARPTLSERLASRLTAPVPAAKHQDEPTAPQLASLPRPAPVASPPAPAAPDAQPPPPGAVASVGYFPHAWYLAVIKEKIFARWSPPSEFFRSARPPVALVSFRIDRAGRLSSVALKEGSGAARFDQSALAAVRGLGVAPPLPEQYGEETLDVVIRFQNEQ
jgi:TonB family protein